MFISHEHIDHLAQDSVGVELHAVGGVLPDLTREAPHHGLEEVVYGKAAVVGTNAAAAVPARLPTPGEIYTILHDAA